MNSWSRNRKRIILAIVIFAVVVLVGIPFFFLFYKAPTCSDAVMNGDETGVDCGGSCQRICSAESLPLILKGDPQVLTIASSTYEVVAVLDNPNQSAEIYKAEYSIKLYGSESAIPVKVIEGSTFIPKGVSFAIFEGPFKLEAGLVAERATLEWNKTSLVWRKNPNPEPDIEIKDQALIQEDTVPRLEATVENKSLSSVENIDLIALITDAEGNIFAASKTYIDSLAPSTETPAVFSWPRPFKTKAVGIQIMKRIFPDRTFIR
jgi:hypothetical protein